MNLENAVHEEYEPENNSPLISKLTCSLVGETQPIRILKNTLAFDCYQAASAIESYQCNFGLNETFKDLFQSENEMKISGVDENETTRIIELNKHPFFLATLFLPQLNSSETDPHPIIKGFITAALSKPEKRQTG